MESRYIPIVVFIALMFLVPTIVVIIYKVRARMTEKSYRKKK